MYLLATILDSAAVGAQNFEKDICPYLKCLWIWKGKAQRKNIGQIVKGRQIKGRKLPKELR